jgi:hypothetical protein
MIRITSAALAVALLAAAPVMAQTQGTPVASIVMSQNGTSSVLPIDLTQWSGPATLLLSAPGGAVTEIDAAPTAPGPWTPLSIIQTAAGSDSYNASTHVLATSLPGYSVPMPGPVPYLCVVVSSLGSGSVTVSVAQAARR